MSRSAARPAEMHASKIATAEAAEAVRCSMLFALPVEDPARFLSSRAAIALFIAAIALASRDKETDKTKTSERTSLFFAFIHACFRRNAFSSSAAKRRALQTTSRCCRHVLRDDTHRRSWLQRLGEARPAGAPTAIRLGADLSNMNTKTAHGFPWAVFYLPVSSQPAKAQ